MVPLGPLRRGVVGEAVGADLLGREVLGHVHRHLGEPELPRGLQPRVAGDDDALGVDDDRLPEPEAADALGDRVDRVVVEAGVARVGADGVDGLRLDLHVTAPPTRYRHGRSFGAQPGDESCGREVEFVPESLDYLEVGRRGVHGGD